MQTVLPATCIFFLFVLAFTPGNANSDEICEDPNGATYESANCDFEQDWCDWRNTLGNEIKWERPSTRIKTHYLRVPMSDASPGSVARLGSRVFQATGNQQCTLQFQYFVPNENCQLSVFLVNDTFSTELVWQPRNSIVPPRFREIEPISLPHSNCRHRIIFEARKLADCSHDYFGVPLMSDNAVEIDIDNIEFRCSSPLTPTTAAEDRTVTTLSSLNPTILSPAVTATSPSSSTGPSSDLSSSSESLSAGGSRAEGATAKREIRTIHLIAGIVLAAVVVLVVLVIVVCRNTSRGGAICGKNLKSPNASSGGAPPQSEANGTVNRTNTGLTHTNPAFVSDDGVTSAYYLAPDQECLYSVPNKPRHGKKATSNGHLKGDNRAANAGQDNYNNLSLSKSRAGPSSRPKPYDHLARGDEHHGDVTVPTPGDRRTGCGTRTLMADVLQSDEHNTLSITTLRASASSAAALPSSARTYDHVPDGERGHQTWPAGDPDPTRASGQAEEVYEHTKW